jgi:uncharacterized membrane protein
MPKTAHGQEMEERLEKLERAVNELSRESAGLQLRMRPLESSLAGVPAPRRTGAGRAEPVSCHPPVRPIQHAPRPVRAVPSAPSDRSPSPSISDLIAGRVLAWLGGIATLLGIVLFLAIAISRGWLDVQTRVVLAGVVSSALMAAGIWLHSRRSRTEASMVLLAVGTAGMFATLVVAGNVYGLIAPLVALGGSMLVGALATVLAIRWAGRSVGAPGLLGALVSPVLVGAPSSTATIAIVAVASGFATWVVISQRWGWLGVATVVAAAPQWGMWLLNGQQTAVELAVLAWFSAIGIAGAVGIRSRPAAGRESVAPVVLASISGSLTGSLGWVALDQAASKPAANLWLAALAIVHLILGLRRSRRLTISDPLRRLLIAIGVILGDAAFGLVASGIGLAIGWGAIAIGFSWLTRRPFTRRSDSVLLKLGVGAHIALTLIRVLLLVGPLGPGSGSPRLMPLLALATLAASCLASGQLISSSARPYELALNALGLAAIAYLTSQSLTGAALVAAWALEAAALIQLARRTQNDVARYGGLAFLALAVIHTLVIEAPPPALLTGVSSLGAAAITLGAIAVASFRGGQTQSEDSRPGKWLQAGGASALLYLVSVAIITSFQPSTGGDSTLLDLGVRQQGQVVLSACWSLIGLVGLIVGLRRDHAVTRNAALLLLLITVGKVFLYDLSTLTSLYLVISFVALGLLLLAGAFGYQRHKPPPAPDIRSVHPSQR